MLTALPQQFLSRAIDPPEISAIDGALTTLTELGAITEEGDLTPMGQHLVGLYYVRISAIFVDLLDFVRPLYQSI